MPTLFVHRFQSYRSLPLSRLRFQRFFRRQHRVDQPNTQLQSRRQPLRQIQLLYQAWFLRWCLQHLRLHFHRRHQHHYHHFLLQVRQLLTPPRCPLWSLHRSLQHLRLHFQHQHQHCCRLLHLQVRQLPIQLQCPQTFQHRRQAALRNSQLQFLRLCLHHILLGSLHFNRLLLRHRNHHRRRQWYLCQCRAQDPA